MLPMFSGAIAAINDLKAQGLIQDYAITGAVALIFWDEAIPTFDLDVLVLMDHREGPLVSLAPIYDWARNRHYAERDEHILINEVPVQFVPAPDALSTEAVQQAKILHIDGVPMRVVGPEYLIALWLTPPANSQRRRERIAKLRESAQLDSALLGDLMARYHFSW